MKMSPELLSLIKTFATSYDLLAQSLGYEEDSKLAEQVNQLLAQYQILLEEDR